MYYGWWCTEKKRQWEATRGVNIGMNCEQRNCLGLLKEKKKKRLQCAAAVVRGYRRAPLWLAGGAVLPWRRSGGYGSVAVRRDLCARGWRKQLLIFWHSSYSREKGNCMKHIGAVESETTLVCTNVSQCLSHLIPDKGFEKGGTK